MEDVIHVALARWDSFYLITGGAAAALTGLQFVVQTLMSSNPVRSLGADDPAAGIEAFGTPTVVHFTTALVISALLCVPWPAYGTLAGTLGVLGAVTLVYAGVVLRRARRQRTYQPVAEDWIFHVVLPIIAYAAVLLAAVLLRPGAAAPEFLIAGATLLLLCVGIHNAWDTVAYLIVLSARTDGSGEARRSPSPSRPPPPRGDRGSRRRRR